MNEAKSLLQVAYTSSRPIQDMPVHPVILNNLSKRGFTSPTEIQDKSLESLLSGSDFLGIAKTGTGKTGAFLVPLLHQYFEQKQTNQVLIILPTRELAVQVESEFESLSRGTGLNACCLIGGTSVSADIRKLRSGVNFVIGTPGRLLDLAKQGELRLSLFKTLVLDEFDRLLDMGFIKDIERIVDGMKSRKQSILFSATMTKEQEPAIGRILNNPIQVKVSDGQSTAEHIQQEVIEVYEQDNKFDMLVKLLEQPDFQKVLVFAETKRGVSGLHKKMTRLGLKVGQIHGDKSQSYRQSTLQSFRRGQIQILLATDVAARGLDIPDVSHVINYQAPGTLDSYIHRIGRTGRAGKTGKAYTFISATNA